MKIIAIYFSKNVINYAANIKCAPFKRIIFGSRFKECVQLLVCVCQLNRDYFFFLFCCIQLKPWLKHNSFCICSDSTKWLEKIGYSPVIKKMLRFEWISLWTTLRAKAFRKHFVLLKYMNGCVRICWKNMNATMHHDIHMEWLLLSRNSFNRWICGSTSLNVRFWIERVISWPLKYPLNGFESEKGGPFNRFAA